MERFKIKNERLLGWIGEALKEHHAEEVDNREAALDKLNKQLNLLSIRLDNLYEDRLDRLIDTETYKKKFEQYTNDKTKVIESIEKLTQVDSSNKNLGLMLFEVSQNAKEVYSKSDIEKKRELIRLIFENLKLSDTTMEPVLNPSFQLLLQAIEETNSSKVIKMAQNPEVTFEPSHIGFIKEKTGELLPACSTWRADERLNPLQARNETNETLKERKLSNVSNAGCFYGLPTDHIIEFQKLALELAGMELSYEEAWEAGHSLINFFDVLLRNDNEIKKSD